MMRALALAFALLLGCSAGAGAKGFAVIVGNAAYQADDIPDVEYAGRDADAVRAWLTQVRGIAPADIIDLRDASLSDLQGVFGNWQTHKGHLFRKVKPGETDVIVFYSGHGVPDPESRTPYLLPVNVKPQDATISGYPLSLLYRNLERIGARSTLVLLDACFSGVSHGGSLMGRSSPVYVQAKAAVPAGLTVLSAAGPNQVATWDDARRLGLFTGHFLDAAKGLADRAEHGGDADGTVTLAEVKAYLDRIMTPAAMDRHGREQQASLAGDRAMVLSSAAPPLPVSDETVIDAEYLAPAKASVRVGPSQAAARLGFIEAGERVWVVSLAGDWLRVEQPNQPAGYVFAQRLRPVRAGDRDPDRRGIARPAPGKRFRDCADCPEMIALPAGSFAMGGASETPVRQVTIAAPFAVAVHEITRAQWKRFVAETGNADGEICYTGEDGSFAFRNARSWRQPGHAQSDSHPAVCISWDDAKAFVAWLARRTGQPYRLLSEAEWEYAARAGATGRYSFGDDATGLCRHGNGADASSGIPWRYGACDDGFPASAPVGSYRANALGLHDMHGNVWEWVEDCAHDSYAGAPSDGRPWLSGGNCAYRVLRSGSWTNAAREMRAASRYLSKRGDRYAWLGLRVARDLAD